MRVTKNETRNEMNSNKTESETVLRIALPRKGRIADALGPICKEAGYEWPSTEPGKALFAKIAPNIEVMFVRSTDVPAIVADGVVDLGVTGTDLVEESGCNLSVVEPLGLFACELVLAAPEKWKELYENEVPKSTRIATSFPLLATKWAEKVGIDIHIIPLSGSVEIAPKLGIADAVIDLTQTGSTLRTNGLEIVESICDVEACFVSALGFDVQATDLKSQQAKIFIEALVSVLNAKGKRYMMMNAPKGQLDKVRAIVPGLNGPTVLDVYGDSEVVAVHVVIEKSELNTVIPKLRALGVDGILVSHIERLIP